jgi:alcohol dehydrogenase class IV
MVGSGATVAAATVGFATTNPNSKSVQYVDLLNDGFGYSFAPIVSISTAPAGGLTATAVAIMTSRSTNQKFAIDRILITNPGIWIYRTSHR